MKQFEALNLVCFNDPDVVELLDRAKTRYEVTQPSGVEKLKVVSHHRASQKVELGA